MVKHLPHISIEKYAAYLDGNLPDEEMKQIRMQIPCILLRIRIPLFFH